MRTIKSDGFNTAAGRQQPKGDIAADRFYVPFPMPRNLKSTTRNPKSGPSSVKPDHLSCQISILIPQMID